ncbi:Swi3-domain-containing protein [Epithele typhae]|uniref:Swi3-domain-containing protein n=1 Tax=Epithele typhae TaxID=378194 RepID=UPI002007CE87|nr:Swi3-domain-containing protein [Epithele typhae]KAH9946087.1 Swi3-domain-containing protein [Epithele typhae]
MASLDDIWDTPAEVGSTQPALPPITISDDEDDAPTQRAGRRRAPKPALFLDSDSEGEAATSGNAVYVSNPRSEKPDIDAFWDDLEDDPSTARQELPPSLDLEALKRQAGEKGMLAYTPHQILPSSSPPPEGDDEEEAEGGKGKDAGKRKSGVGLKKRPKLDQARLLGPDGFPALVKQAKEFKPKGKGHEVSDLNRLLNIYQFWGHKMYPPSQFSDTVQRVEKHCHTKRLQVALGAWRDEFHGLINGRKPEEEGEDDSDKDEHDATAARLTDHDVPLATDNERSSPSRGPSVPPSSASELAFDDFDIDAMIHDDENARRRTSTKGPSLSTTTSVPAMSSAVTDEDEAMWDAMMGDMSNEPTVSKGQPPASKPSAPPPPEEDEDMWDLVREAEMEAEAATKVPAVAPASSVATPAPPTDPPGQQSAKKTADDDYWDDMYLDE